MSKQKKENQPDQNENAVVPKSPNECKKVALYVLAPEQWHSLIQVLAKCPAGEAGEAHTWMKAQKPVDINMTP